MKDNSNDYKLTMVSFFGRFFAYDVVNINGEWILKTGSYPLASVIADCPFDSDLKWNVFG